MLRFLLHYGIHLLLPVAVGLMFYKEYRIKAILILLAGIVLDVDHLVTDPIFDPNRCSINFHPLHSYWAIAAYVSLLFYSKTRMFGVAFLIHMLADSTDCYLLFLQSK